MLVLTGKIVSGLGEAGPNLKQQLPFLINSFPEIKDCYHGSINLELSEPLKILRPDFISDPIKWWFGREDVEEQFSITRIKFENNHLSVGAWIYDPHQSPHRRDLLHVEIIAPSVRLSRDRICKIYIDREHKTKPFYLVV